MALISLLLGRNQFLVLRCNAAARRLIYPSAVAVVSCCQFSVVTNIATLVTGGDDNREDGRFPQVSEPDSGQR